MGTTKKRPSPRQMETWLNEKYNYGLETYVHPSFVRLTNGSAAHYLDIRSTADGRIEIRGERYGETIDKECEANRDSLIETLSGTI